MASSSKSVYNQAFDGIYSDQQSDISKIHKKFREALQRKRISESDLTRRLKECRTNYDKIRVIINILNWDTFKFSSRTVEKYRKSDDLATQFRQTANELYKIRQFTRALRGYNLAIVFSVPDGKELSIALANRSALFLETKNPRLALQDIIRAQAHGYPETLLPKLLERRVKCLNLAGIDLNSLKSVPTNFFRLEKTFSDEFKERKAFCQTELFELKSPNPSIPTAESYIAILTNPDRGRHVVTTQAVNPGTLLIVDQPYSKILLNGFKWDLDHCHHCHRRMSSGIPCPKCVFAVFCNDECLKNSFTYHQYECHCGPFLHHLKAPRTLILALRILCSVGPAELHRIFREKDPKYFSSQIDPSSPLLGSENGVYSSSSYLPIYHLISHPAEYKGPEIVSYALTSLALVAILESATSFFETVVPSSEELPEFKLFVASLVLLHMQNLPCNAHSLNELRGMEDANPGSPDQLAERIKTACLMEYGAGAFALLSLINHSCDPNVTRVNLHSGLTAVVAIRPLQPGDELLDNYGAHYALNSYSERRRELRENYYFDCTCIACEGKWPLLPELKSLPETLVCGECSKLKFSLAQRLKQEFMDKCVLTNGKPECLGCETIYEIPVLAESLNMKVDSLFVAHEQLLQNEPLKALNGLKASIDYFANHLLPPFVRTNDAQETLKQALNLIVYSDT